MRTVFFSASILGRMLIAGGYKQGRDSASMGSTKSDDMLMTAAPTTKPMSIMYTRTMHPDVISSTLGKCPKYEMDLVVKE